jgi:hypothetical protein
MNTRHAEIRGQQRGLPPLVGELLDRFGREEHTTHGAVVVYLSKASIREMERALGRRAVACVAQWLDAYKVLGSDGQTITIGHRTQRIWRKK